MKRHLLPVLAAAALLAFPLVSHAQSAVPGQITYQGKVTDAAGALIGSPSPVNRTVIFRIYDHGTSVLAANRLHTEQQVVTIANGEFNVLVGAGSAVSGETFVTSLDTVFTGPTRYLGVTVDDGNAGTVDPEISPRQQIVTMPYAFRAKVAESVAGSAATSNLFQSSGNVGIGTNAPAAPLTLFSSANDAKFLLQTTASGATASDGLAVIHSNAGYIFEYEAVPLHLGTSSAVRMTVAANGNVGIGTQTPGALLSLGNTLANTKLAMWDDGAGSFYGLGVQGNQFRFHTGGTGDRFSFLGGAAGPEVFTVGANGFVGIGITAPVAPLQIYTADNNSKILLQHTGTGTTQTSGLGLIESNKGYLWQYANLPLLIGTNSATRMTFTADGKVAVGGGENPGALFSLGGSTANTKLALWDNEAGAMYGLGMGANQMRFHTKDANDRFSFLASAGATAELVTILSTGNVGVGLVAPVAPLHVHTQTTDSRILLTSQSTGSASTDGLAVGTSAGSTFVWNHEATPLTLATNSVPRLTIESDGRTGFNAFNTDFNLGYLMYANKNYQLVITDNAGWAYSLESNGVATKRGSNTWAIFSDARLKKNIAPLTDSLDRLLRLRSVTFDYKDEARGQGRQTGFIAQEVREVFPDWVKPGRGDYLTIETKGFDALTVQALRELRTEKDTQIAQRDAKIAALEQRVHDLESETSTRLAAIERRLNATAVTANSPR